MKKGIILLIILIFLIIIAIFFITNSLTGKTIQETKEDNIKTRTYTKAICNSSNYCQDYEIACNGNQTISTTPITGAVVQHSQDWQDPRNESEELC